MPSTNTHNEGEPSTCKVTGDPNLPADQPNEVNDLSRMIEEISLRAEGDDGKQYNETGDINGPDSTNAHEILATSPPSSRFEQLPSELVTMVLEQLGSCFFLENVRRLTVSSRWYAHALPVMYGHMDISRMWYPFAPITRCLEHRWNKQLLSNEAGPCPSCAKSPYIDKIKTALGHTHCLTLDVDDHLRSFLVSLPQASDEVPPLRLSALEQPVAACQPPRASGELFQTRLSWASHAVQILHIAPNVKEFECRMMEPWGFRASDHQFDHVLGESIRLQPELRALALDLVGLSEAWLPSKFPDRDRGFSWQLEFLIEFIEEPRTWTGVTDTDRVARHFSMVPRRGAMPGAGLLDELERRPPRHPIGESDDIPVFSWPLRGHRYHFCHAIRAALPRLEVLTIRLPSVCASLFRDLENKNNRTDELPLPKLKKVVIDLRVPQNKKFTRNRICHCAAEEWPLSPEKVHLVGGVTVENMRKELKRLVNRMKNPKEVWLLYPMDRDLRNPASRTLGEHDVEPHFYFLWNAVTDRIHFSEM